MNRKLKINKIICYQLLLPSFIVVGGGVAVVVVVGPIVVVPVDVVPGVVVPVFISSFVTGPVSVVPADSIILTTVVAGTMFFDVLIGSTVVVTPAKVS